MVNYIGFRYKGFQALIRNMLFMDKCELLNISNMGSLKVRETLLNPLNYHISRVIW